MRVVVLDDFHRTYEDGAGIGRLREQVEVTIYPQPASSLDALVAAADVVSIHLALSDESRGLFAEARLRRMRPTAYLVNSARGAIVDEAALVRVLRENAIAGAALDGFVQE